MSLKTINILIFSICFLGCKSNKKDLINPLSQPSVILFSPEYIDILLESKLSLDMHYGYRLNIIDTNYYFSVLDTSNTKVISYNLNKQKIVKINYEKKIDISKISNLHLTTHKNGFYSFYRPTCMVYVLSFKNDILKITDSIPLVNFDTTKYLINLPEINVIKNKLSYKVIYNYSDLKKRKSNFCDSTNIFAYSNNNGVQNYQKMGYYPSKYFTEYISSNQSLYKMLDDSICVLTFMMSDEIALLNINNGSILKKSKLQNHSNFPKFDTDRKTDIGYKRNLLSKSEKNINIIITHNKYIVVIKKLPTASLNALPKKKYFIFDKELNLKYVDTIKEKHIVGFYEPYKNGFLLLSNLRNKLIYYEIK